MPGIYGLEMEKWRAFIRKGDKYRRREEAKITVRMSKKAIMSQIHI